MSEPHVTDAELLRFIRAHPHVRARDVARKFYTVKAQLAVGARLKRLVRAGELTEAYRLGWRYSVPEARDDAHR